MLQIKLALYLLVCTAISNGFAFIGSPFAQGNHAHRPPRASVGTTVHSATSSESSSQASSATSIAPNLDGKRVLPFKVLMPGLQGHRVAAVYAILNQSYQRGSKGWEYCEYVGVTQDVTTSLQNHWQKHGADKVAHVRTLTFATPDPNAMQQIATDWKHLAAEAGVTLKAWDVDSLEYLFDDDDDDDEMDDSELLAARLAEAEGMVYIRPKEKAVEDKIVSPFNNSSTETNTLESAGIMEFTKQNVDKVLNEVRPYLIADGGNVKVERVDEVGKNVYLKLEGACGSCESSTVTMQMGIERTLRENFADLGQVVRVDSDDAKPKELTMKVVEEEVNRLKPAIQAMGGQCDIVKVDSVTGTVDIKFRGASKVRQGLELALLDVPLLNKVNFVMGDD